MKNEAGLSPYEACLRHTERLLCASLHASVGSCFMETVRFPLHVCKANASLSRFVPLLVSFFTRHDFNDRLADGIADVLGEVIGGKIRSDGNA